MTATNHPPLHASLGKDLIRIHRVITRGLEIAQARGAEFLQEGFPDSGIRQGYADYAHCLAVVLEGHHSGEDNLLFPVLRERIASAPYEQLASDHRRIVTLLNPVRQAIPAVGVEGDGTSLARLVEGLGQVAAVWAPHIRLEEEHFSPADVDGVITPEEQASLGTAMARHSQEHAIPAPLTVPFVLYNLDAGDRAEMAAALPPAVMEELVPKTWKAQWASMQPFLLD